MKIFIGVINRERQINNIFFNYLPKLKSYNLCIS